MANRSIRAPNQSSILYVITKITPTLMAHAVQGFDFEACQQEIKFGKGPGCGSYRYRHHCQEEYELQINF